MFQTHVVADIQRKWLCFRASTPEANTCGKMPSDACPKKMASKSMSRLNLNKCRRPERRLATAEISRNQCLDVSSEGWLSARDESILRIYRDIFAVSVVSSFDAAAAKMNYLVRAVASVACSRFVRNRLIRLRRHSSIPTHHITAKPIWKSRQEPSSSAVRNAPPAAAPARLRRHSACCR